LRRRQDFSHVLNTLSVPVSSLAKRRVAPEAPRGVREIFRHLPWIAAVLIAPFWMGSVKPEAQAVLSLLIGSSLLLCFRRESENGSSRLEIILLAGITIALLAPVLPLPARLVGSLSPERLSLAREFPLNAGEAPRFLPFALATGPAINRLWQLAMLAAVFLLAKQGVKEESIRKMLPIALGGALVLLSLTEVWFLWDGHGVWNQVRNYPAGTFASRNHYASWIVMGTLFCMGAFKRKAFGIREIFLGAGIVMGITTVIACGSRGGLLALIVGLAVFCFLSRKEKEHNGWIIGAALGVIAIALVFAGGLLRYRLGHLGLDFKFQIWREALALVPSYPVFGIGLGGFEAAFNHYKTFHGTGTFLHAENEYLQWLLETGIIGFVLGATLLAAVCVRFFKIDNRVSDSLFMAGCLAGVAALAAHACVEFVLQVPATGLLGVVLFGCALGMHEKAHKPIVPKPAGLPRILMRITLAFALLCVGGFQAFAAVEWHRGKTTREIEHYRASLGLWRLNSKRSLALAKTYENVPSAPNGRRNHLAAREVLNRALFWDPYNWELRLERAWVDIADAETLNRGIDEARETQKLNRLQPRISMEFAKYFGCSNPGMALQFLRGTPAANEVVIKEMLKLAREISPAPSVLWEVTPATPLGFMALGDFAMEQNLPRVASEAYRRVDAPAEGIKLALKLLAAGDPEGALEKLKTSPDCAAKEELLTKCDLALRTRDE
jgi:O-antigen ligase